MAERVRRDPLGDARPEAGHSHRALQRCLMEVMPPLLPACWLGVVARRGEDPLPGPLATRVWILARERVGHRDPPCPRSEVGLVHQPNVLDVLAQRLYQSLG